MQLIMNSVAGAVLLVVAVIGVTSAGFAVSAPEGLHGEHQQEHHEAKPYNFGYGVVSHKHGVDFGQQETSDGHNVAGHYRVKLPDGRTQVVTYTADWQKGYNAHVQYEGHSGHQESGLEHGGLGEGVGVGIASSGYGSGAGLSYGSEGHELEQSSAY